MYITEGYIACGYIVDEPYIVEGYIDSGYIDTYQYLENGYIVSGYFEGCGDTVMLNTVSISFSFDYLFIPPSTPKTAVLTYLYDNQITLEPLRIVREKIT